MFILSIITITGSILLSSDCELIHWLIRKSCITLKNNFNVFVMFQRALRDMFIRPTSFDSIVKRSFISLAPVLIYLNAEKLHILLNLILWKGHSLWSYCLRRKLWFGLLGLAGIRYMFCLSRVHICVLLLFYSFRHISLINILDSNFSLDFSNMMNHLFDSELCDALLVDAI